MRARSMLRQPCNVRFIASDLRNLRKQFILSDADELADQSGCYQQLEGIKYQRRRAPLSGVGQERNISWGYQEYDNLLATKLCTVALVMNRDGILFQYSLATEGWKWALKVHEQGEVDSNRWNRCRLLLHNWLGQIEFWDSVQMNRQMTQAQDRKRPCLCITYQITL